MVETFLCHVGQFGSNKQDLLRVRNQPVRFYANQIKSNPQMFNLGFFFFFFADLLVRMMTNIFWSAHNTLLLNSPLLVLFMHAHS